MSNRVITCRLSLDAPLILSLPGGDANSTETLSYLSGSSILGVLAGMWLKKNGKKGSLGGDKGFRTLFLEHHLRCANGYPEGRKRQRLLPSPFSLYAPKDDDEKVYDLTSEEHHDLQESGMSLWPQRFISIDREAEAINYISSEKEVMIHHQRERDKGRATEEKGAVFSYVSLPSGARYITHIFCDEVVDAAEVISLLDGSTMHMGRSKKVQYGGKVKVEVLYEERQEKFSEAGSYETLRIGQTYTVTLTSDYLGCGPNGCWQAGETIWLHDFAEAIGLFPEQLKLADDSPIPLFARIKQVSGYVAPWAMPRPLRTGLRAGTTILFTVAAEVKSDQIQQALWQGLGDRRAEGFGRFVLNWAGGGTTPDTPYTASVIPEIAETTPNTEEMDVDSKEMLQFCWNRLFVEELKAKLTERIKEFVTYLNQTKGIPPKSVLNRVRQQIQAASNAEGISTWLQEVKASKNKKFGNHLLRCWIPELNQNLLGRLQVIFENQDEIKKLLDWHRISVISDLFGQESGNDFTQYLWWSQQKFAESMLLELIQRKKREEEEL